MLLLGNGSNILVSDEGVRGAVVCTADVDEVRVGEDDNTLTAEAGALLSRIARRAQRARSYRARSSRAAFRQPSAARFS